MSYASFIFLSSWQSEIFMTPLFVYSPVDWQLNACWTWDTFDSCSLCSQHMCSEQKAQQFTKQLSMSFDVCWTRARTITIHNRVTEVWYVPWQSERSLSCLDLWDPLYVVAASTPCNSGQPQETTTHLYTWHDLGYIINHSIYDTEAILALSIVGSSVECNCKLPAISSWYQEVACPVFVFISPDSQAFIVGGARP